MEVDDGKGGKFTFSFSGSLDNTQLSKFNQIVDLVKDDPQTKEIELPEGYLNITTPEPPVAPSP